MGKVTDTPRKPPARRRPAKTAADPTGDDAALRLALREALERQAATSDILHAIASTPSDAALVLGTIAQTARQLLRASGAGIVRMDEGGVLRRIATAGLSAPISAYSEARQDRGTTLGRAVLEKRTVHVEDILRHAAEFPEGAAARGKSSNRTILATPLMREGEAIGAINVTRTEVRPFTAKEIELLESFADQAVIAIENARLLDELNVRNRDLAEALEQQTATSEILRTIASAPGEAQRALDTIAETTARMFDAMSVSIRRVDGDVARAIGLAGQTAAIVHSELPTLPLDHSTLAGRAIVEGRQIQREGLEPVPDGGAEAAKLIEFLRRTGVRATVATPLLREGRAIGAIIVHRGEKGPFAEKELQLLRNFADQAVIAIENARLLAELRESLDRRTAIAEVLQVISSSPGELQPVFETMLKSAVRLCEAWTGSVFRIEGDIFRRVTSVNVPDELVAQVELHFAADLPAGRMLSSKSTVHIVDVMAELEHRPDHATLRMAAERTGARSALWVPMVKDNEVVAAFVLSRRERRGFTEAQIGLVENFASQAVIAIDNARLLAELREARDAAERSLVELRAAQASLIQAEKMASLGQLTAGIAHEIKNPLNFVNNFAGLSVELLHELKETAAPVFSKAGLGELAEVNEIVGMLTSNLEKIAEHGRRADGIVKSMLAHSRGGSGERREVNLSSLVEEALNLAYHGARAQDQDFNVTLERDLDPAIAPIEVVPQELTRVFLNLFANGFYAADKRRKESGDPAFNPVLNVTTRDLGAAVEIRIRDNGVGIPAEHKARLFEPFFTTKPTGEGTGLGLSISYDIVTQQHGGTIEVESEPGSFTEFCIALPRRTAPAAGVDRSVAE